MKKNIVVLSFLLIFTGCASQEKPMEYLSKREPLFSEEEKKEFLEELNPDLIEDEGEDESDKNEETIKNDKEIKNYDSYLNQEVIDRREVGNTKAVFSDKKEAEAYRDLNNRELEEDKKSGKSDEWFIGDIDNKDESVGFVKIKKIDRFVLIDFQEEETMPIMYSVQAVKSNNKPFEIGEGTKEPSN